MSRPPIARNRVLDAARQIVMERGAGALTYEELVEVSGITRGGITYHFATKQDLLRALIEHDLQHWDAAEAEHRPQDEPEALADLLGFLRVHTAPDTDRRRFVSGMVGAAMHDPSVLEPARAYEAERLAKIDDSDAALRQQLLRLAAMGMFWADFFGCPELPEPLKDRLRDLLEALAREWTEPASSAGD
ncbi:MAG: TetR/AcrR family transcriptional regulator [Pseudomonadota bacterium]